MIRNILLSCLFFTLMWGLLIGFLPDDLNTVQNQSNGNVIKAEGFLFDKKQGNLGNVILGSSLSARLNFESSLVPSINLAFGGLSALDGLWLLKAKKCAISNLYIEVNTLNRPANIQFYEEIFSPIKYNLRLLSPVFQTRYQPVGVIKALMKYRKKSIKYSHLNLSIIKDVELDSNVVNQIKLDHNVKPQKDVIRRNIETLKAACNLLELKGSKIIFFQMPLDASICQTEESIFLINELVRVFPKNKYLYIPQPNCSEYNTVDGIHLTSQSANKYVNYFVKVLNNNR